jgi:hypothetical protein
MRISHQGKRPDRLEPFNQGYNGGLLQRKPCYTLWKLVAATLGKRNTRFERLSTRDERK